MSRAASMVVTCATTPSAPPSGRWRRSRPRSRRGRRRPRRSPRRRPGPGRPGGTRPSRSSERQSTGADAPVPRGSNPTMSKWSVRADRNTSAGLLGVGRAGRTGAARVDDQGPDALRGLVGGVPEHLELDGRAARVGVVDGHGRAARTGSLRRGTAPTRAAGSRTPPGRGSARRTTRGRESARRWGGSAGSIEPSSVSSESSATADRASPAPASSSASTISTATARVVESFTRTSLRVLIHALRAL